MGFSGFCGFFIRAHLRPGRDRKRGPADPDMDLLSHLDSLYSSDTTWWWQHVYYSCVVLCIYLFLSHFVVIPIAQVHYVSRAHTLNDVSGLARRGCCHAVLPYIQISSCQALWSRCVSGIVSSLKKENKKKRDDVCGVGWRKGQGRKRREFYSWLAAGKSILLWPFSLPVLFLMTASHLEVGRASSYFFHT